MNEEQPEPQSEEQEQEVVETETTKNASDIELEQLREYRDKYVRLLAENENTRKRYQRDLNDSVRHAVGDVILEFLKPVDQLENALQFADQAASEVKNWAIGFKMILTQFYDALATHGVIAYDSTGHPFDPHLHEAIEMVESDTHPAGIIIEQVVRGYKMGDNTLRPAQVKVAKAPEKSDTTTQEEGDNDNGGQ